MAGAVRSVAAREGASVPKIHMSKSATPTVIYYNKYMSFYKDRVFWFIFAALALVKIVAFLGIYFFPPAWRVCPFFSGFAFVCVPRGYITTGWAPVGLVHRVSHARPHPWISGFSGTCSTAFS